MQKFGNYFLVLLFISPIIPTLNFEYNLRIDQILIYTLFLIILFFYFQSLLNFNIYKLAFPFISFLIIIILAYLIFNKKDFLKTDYQMVNFFSNIEDVTLIISLIIILVFFFQNIEKKNLKKRLMIANQILIGCMLFNTLIAIISVVSENFYSYVHNIYIDNSNYKDLKTVASRAYNNGRYLGIFNQPSTAGIFYALSLFTLIQQKNNFSFFKYTFIFIVICVGGILTMSKTFILFIPLFLLIFFLQNKFFIRILIIFLSIFCLYIIYPWLELMFLHAMVEPIRIFDFLSGGRYAASTSPLIEAGDLIYYYSPYIGFGAGSFAASQLPADSLWNYINFMGGIISLTIFVIYFSIIFYYVFFKSIKFRHYYLLSLFFYYFIVSFGAPLLFLNKLSVILITIFYLNYLIMTKK